MLWPQESGVTQSIDSAQARVGRPLTPVSSAGVARRTTRRAVVRGAVVVAPQAVQSHPANPEILTALISFNGLAGDVPAALGYAKQLAAIAPEDRGLAALIQELRRAVESPVQ